MDLATARLRWKEAACDARYTVAGDGLVIFIERGSAVAAGVSLVCRELQTGKLRWRRSQTDLPWLSKVRRCVYHKGLLVCEISRLTDEKQGNAIQVFSAADGTQAVGPRLRPFRHAHEAGGRCSSAICCGFSKGPRRSRTARGCVGLDPRTGVVRKTWPASLTHCFPPVATCRYLISGEMDFTDLSTGALDANQITKAACSRDAGVAPANGLLYTFPKHCVCWPMLRDYAALAPAGGPSLRELRFAAEPGRRRRRPAFPGKTRRSTGRAIATMPSAAAARRGSCRDI